MKQVLAAITARRRDLESHPFFDWLHSEGTPLPDRFAFSPLMIDFIMGFSDMNKWFLRYPEPMNKYERGINEHTREDQTHSRIFIEDWLKLELDTRVAWSAGETLWWLFNCGETDRFRGFGMETIAMMTRHPEALVRFALMEAIEVCGDVFFSHTSAVAVELEKKTGVEYRYYGVYHHLRETGHLQTDESHFSVVELRAAQRRAALALVHRVFEIFVAELDQLLDFSRRATRQPEALAVELAQERAAELARRGGDLSRWPLSPRPLSPSASQRPLVAEVERRRRKIAEHPFLVWLSGEGARAPADTLRRFAPVWGIDLAGYKDFNEKVLRYPTPTTPAERAINRWATDLATHWALYLSDWHHLGLDERLGWGACETIAFLFLSRLTEMHRRNMAKVKHYAFSYDAPELRYWLMYALETAGEPFFAATRSLAQRAELEIGGPLDYFAHRHYLAHRDQPADAEADAVDFSRAELSPEAALVALGIIETVFTNIEEQLTQSLLIAEHDMLEVAGGNPSHPRLQAWLVSFVESRRGSSRGPGPAGG